MYNVFDLYKYMSHTSYVDFDIYVCYMSMDSSATVTHVQVLIYNST